MFGRYAVLLTDTDGAIGTGFIVASPDGPKLITTAHLAGSRPASDDWSKWRPSISVHGVGFKVTMPLFDPVGRPLFSYLSMLPPGQVHDVISLTLDTETRLSLDDLGWPAVVELLTDLPSPGDPVTAYGCMRHGSEGKVALMEREGVALPSEHPLYGRSTLKTVPGHSGGPVFDKAGALCGVMVGYEDDSSIIIGSRLISHLASQGEPGDALGR
jgi:hypothetical protein